MTKDYSTLSDLFGIASSYALSFKGYEYMQENQEFDNLEKCQAFLNGEEIPENEMFPVLFCFQRSISKNPQDEKEEKAFFDLFLACIDLNLEIPQKYIDDRYYPEWETHKKDIQKIKEAISKKYR